MKGMKTLRQCIAEAKAAKQAIGHFNISTIDQLHAIVAAAEKLKLPVIIGVSEGERDFIGVEEAVSLVQALRKEGKPVYLNADHTYSVERVKEAIDDGFDMAIFDGAKLSFDDNLAQTKQCVAYARASGREVLIEGELGYIGSSSKVLDAIPDGAIVSAAEMTTVREAKKFVDESGIDLFSPAIGSIHGMLRETHDPDLNIGRLQEIAQAIPVPLVLHGASGLKANNIQAAIAAGISIVHVSTELRVAWKQALKIALQEEPDEVAPYKILKGPKLAVQKVVEEKLHLFTEPAVVTAPSYGR